MTRLSEPTQEAVCPESPTNSDGTSPAGIRSSERLVLPRMVEGAGQT